MKKLNLFSRLLFLAAMTCLVPAGANAQVTVGSGATPRATLDVVALPNTDTTANGIIAPNLTLAELKAADGKYLLPQTGAIVYVTDATGTTTLKTAKVTAAGYYYFDGTVWQAFKGEALESWLLDGNNNGALKTIGTNDDFDLPFETNGTERMRLTTSGNLGINTTAPRQKLHIAEGKALIANRDALSDDSTIDSQLIHASGGLHVIGVNSDTADNIRLSSVSEGYQIPSFIFSKYQATFDADGKIETIDVPVPGQIMGAVQWLWDGKTGPDGMGLSMIGSSAGQHPETSSMFFRTSNAMRMTIDEEGNVGIGTRTPTEKLDVDGQARVRTLTPNASVPEGSQVVIADADGVLSKTLVSAIQPAAPVITTQPRSFSWKETTGAGDLTGIGGNATTVSVTATNATSYQWYEVARNPAAAPILISGANTAAYTPELSALGMRQYYCLIGNAFGTIKSDIAKVAVGCGAMTAGGQWRTFMCYNLGATATTINAQMTTAGNVYHSSSVGAVPATGYTGANAYSAVFGDLYQWGRVADGHEKRSSQNSATTNAPSVGPYTAFDNTWASGGSEQVTGVDKGKFIVNSSSSTGADKGTHAPYDWNANPTSKSIYLWRNYRYIHNDPCANLGPAGTIWRIPTHSEWGAIFRGDEGAGSPNIAVANTWSWKAPGTATDNATGTAGGYELKPDGVTTTLFLPAAGGRGYGSGQLYHQGVYGHYWSATAYGAFSHNLNFTSGNVVPAHCHNRAHGFSVRCIAEL